MPLNKGTKPNTSKIKKLKVHIRRLIVWTFTNNKNATETAKIIVVLIAKVSLMTVKLLFSMSFRYEPRPNFHQTLINML